MEVRSSGDAANDPAEDRTLIHLARNGAIRSPAPFYISTLAAEARGGFAEK
jgi:hypothetical protein